MRKALFILGMLDDSDIDWMIATGQRQRIPAKAVLIQEGQAVDYVCIVLEGTFAVRVSALGGKDIAQLRAGEVVGEMSFVDSRPPSASVVALEDSWVLSIPHSALKKRLDNDGFAARFYRALAVFLANRLRNTTARLGYGKAAADPPTELGEEIGPMALQNLAMAGARLDWMMRRLRGE